MADPETLRRAFQALVDKHPALRTTFHVLDGEPVNACLVMAWQLQGRRVTTIEAMAEDPASQPVRQALARCGAVQCGYCSAGMVMTLTHLHRQVPAPSAAQAVELMCGNLCRCTGYGGLTRAIDELFG